ARPILFFAAAAVVYLIFSIVSGIGQAWLERRANRGYA
ncbi:MAG: histidine transporter permease HisQ, partial [Proteobacteria bacterium]|nr:histidine transporter permease HisQ [Pseudomonadota bacterium]